MYIKCYINAKATCCCGDYYYYYYYFSPEDGALVHIDVGLAYRDDTKSEWTEMAHSFEQRKLSCNFTATKVVKTVARLLNYKSLLILLTWHTEPKLCHVWACLCPVASITQCKLNFSAVLKKKKKKISSISIKYFRGLKYSSVCPALFTDMSELGATPLTYPRTQFSSLNHI